MTLINLSTTGIALVLPAFIQNDLQRRQTTRELRVNRVVEENDSLEDARQRLQANRTQRLNELEQNLRQTAR